MLSIIYLLLFFTGGLFISRCLLPRLRPAVRAYLGLSLGVFLLMWLPALWAYGVCFSFAAHWLALGTLLLLCAGAYLLRDKSHVRPWREEEKGDLIRLGLMVLPLTVLAGWLQYTHSIRLAADGSYHVGQSTYGDLSLHLAVCTSIVNAKFPLHNSLMLGATMAYPYLSDSFATSLYMLGLPLNAAMALTGTVMMALVFVGYALLCQQLCRKKGGAVLAYFLLFLNGGMGFLYTLDATVQNGVVTSSLWDNLRNVMEGYYQTPTNQPDPHNLRWVNIICDMLVPQRGILGGWTILMPCLNLLLPPLSKREKPALRSWLLLGVLAGGLPLIHTHSYLALVLSSAGMCAYCLMTAPKGERWNDFRPWLMYGAVAAALSLPQLLCFTFVQATGSDHFLSVWFNWANNRGGRGLVDTYLWFYLKNVGIPYVLIFLPLLRRRPKGGDMPEDLRQHRMIACGAFLIYLIAELFKFQPNEYDNNKLLYVWFLLCLPMAADYAVSLWERLRGLSGRQVLAGLFLVGCFASSTLTVARECVSDYYAYSPSDVRTAEYVQQNTPEHCVFLTGDQHLNPVSSLAGRTIVCSTDLYLYYHGFNTSARHAEVSAFYQSPAQCLDLLRKYQVEYIYVSAYERYSESFTVDEDTIAVLFPLVFEDGNNRIYQVPEEYRQ